MIRLPVRFLNEHEYYRTSLNTYWLYMDACDGKYGVPITLFIPAVFALGLGICFQGRPCYAQLVPHSV